MCVPQAGRHESESLGMSKYTIIYNKESPLSTWDSPGMTWPTVGLQEPSGQRPGYFMKWQAYVFLFLWTINLFPEQQ